MSTVEKIHIFPLRCSYYFARSFVSLFTCKTRGNNLSTRNEFRYKTSVKLATRYISVLLFLAQISSAFPSTTIGYNRDIRPILSENCFSCHGPDAGARKAKLRLDRFED